MNLSVKKFIESRKNKDFHTPVYIYQKDRIKERIALLKRTFENFNILYSMKSNPNKEIIGLMKEHNIGIDAASPNEVLEARKLGFNVNDILYSSPGKSVEYIARTFDKSIIIADSISEIFRINDLMKFKGKILNIGIRLNLQPIKKFDSFEIMSGENSHFGISLSDFTVNYKRISRLKNIVIKGVHVYSASQILNWEDIYLNVKNIFDVVDLLELKFNQDFNFINFGGGFGIPYQDYETEIDLNTLKINIEELLKGKLKKRRLIIESGRFLVGDSGLFITEILDIKIANDIPKIIIKGGMNSFFRPIFTKQTHKIGVLNSSKQQLTYDIVGNSCTPLDVIARNVKINKCKIGDLLVIYNAGAYGYTMSLTNFISPEEVKEILI